jgi:hypothetical protein
LKALRSHKVTQAPAKILKGNGKASNADLDRIMAVNVERLCWPENDDRDKIGTRNKGDDERKGQNARFLLQSRREYGVLGSKNFPKTKPDEEEEAENKGN